MLAEPDPRGLWPGRQQRLRVQGGRRVARGRSRQPRLMRRYGCAHDALTSPRSRTSRSTVRARARSSRTAVPRFTQWCLPSAQISTDAATPRSWRDSTTRSTPLGPRLRDASTWSSRSREDTRNWTTSPRLASGCHEPQSFVASSMRAPRVPVIDIDDHALSLQEFGGLLRTYTGWGMRIVFAEDDNAEPPSSRYETSRMEKRLTNGGDPGRIVLGPLERYPRSAPGLVPLFPSPPRVSAPPPR